ncbi:U-box domain-containing protein 43-like, partial [Trifolium pratense]
EGVVEYLFRPRRLEALVGFLENDGNNVQVTAAGLLANLPNSKRKFTMQLINLGGLDAIIHILKNVTAKARAAAFIGDLSMSTPKLTANALPGLIRVLQEEVHATAYEAIQTLSTLVLEDFLQRGARVLHESNAIRC